MSNGKLVYSQLLDFLDRNHFNYLVRKYDGDKYVKNFTCYNQLAVLCMDSFPTVKVSAMLCLQRKLWCNRVHERRTHQKEVSREGPTYSLLGR